MTEKKEFNQVGTTWVNIYTQSMISQRLLCFFNLTAVVLLLCIHIFFAVHNLFFTYYSLLIITQF